MDLFDATFFSDVYGKTWHESSGDVLGAATLLQWGDVNTILQNHWHDPQIVRLVQAGRPLLLSEYVEPRRWRGQLNLSEFYRIISEGASLVIEDVASWQPKLFGVSLRAEAALRESVETQLFVSGPKTSGFGVHWDPYDVFAVQLLGQRTWDIYQPTRQSPMLIDKASPDPPASQPVATVKLQEGDVLYIPRGWWHNVGRADLPSAHLTIVVPKRTGVDFLLWLAEEVRSERAARQDVSRLQNPSALHAFMDELRQSVDRLMTPNRVQEYITDWDVQADSKVRFSFPWILENESGRYEELQILCLVPRATLTVRDHTCVLRADGKEWTFAAVAEVPLKQIMQKLVLTVTDLQQHCAVSGPEIKRLLEEFVMAGLVALSAFPKTGGSDA